MSIGGQILLAILACVANGFGAMLATCWLLINTGNPIKQRAQSFTDRHETTITGRD